MKIKYLGHSCFFLQGEDGVSVITDPYTKVGYELPQGLKSDILFISHGHFDHCYSQAVNYRSLISETGEWECFGVNINGIDSFHDPLNGKLRGKNVIFKFEIDGLKVCHFGDLGEPYSEELCEKIGEVDVLLLPVGGTYTIDAKQAFEYVQKLAPKVVIPMHYKPLDGALDIAAAEDFLSLFSETEIQRVPYGEYELALDNLSKELPILYMERAKE